MKRIRKILTGCAMAAAVAQLTGCTQIEEWKDTLFTGNAETESELSENQRKAKIQVVSITGNELTYIEETEESTEEESEADTEAVSEVISEEEQSSRGRGRSENGEKTGQNRSFGDGEKPDMSQMSDGGNMPDMSQMFGDGEMPDMSQISGNREMPDMSQMFGKEEKTNEKGWTASEQTVTVYLPVGVKVYTETGKRMSFSILEAGDQLEVLFETNTAGNEVITEIQMLGE